VLQNCSVKCVFFLSRKAQENKCVRNLKFRNILSLKGKETLLIAPCVVKGTHTLRVLCSENSLNEFSINLKVVVQIVINQDNTFVYSKQNKT
jgi:hypothetical protein